MDDGELEYSNQDVLGDPNTEDLDSLIAGFLKDNHQCSHMHTCNPPGPDSSHSHTCYHVHTKILPAPDEDKVATDDTAESSETKSKKRPLGNREAVRKYREKKKARAASLEDEVFRLRALNQQLLKRLQGQAALEAEIARLKCLLVDIRGRIEGEIGSFPYQKSAKNGDGIQNMPHPNLSSSAYVMNPCDLRCDDQVYCLHPGMEGKGGDGLGLNGEGFNACDIGNVHCMGNPNLGLKELPGCGNVSIGAVPNSLNANKRRGGARAATGG